MIFRTSKYVTNVHSIYVHWWTSYIQYYRLFFVNQSTKESYIASTYIPICTLQYNNVRWLQTMCDIVHTCAYIIHTVQRSHIDVRFYVQWCTSFDINGCYSTSHLFWCVPSLSVITSIPRFTPNVCSRFQGAFWCLFSLPNLCGLSSSRY